MIQLDRPQISDRQHDIELAVDDTPGIDHWCSGPDWAMPANNAFAPTSSPLILESANGFGFALFAEFELGDNKVVSGLDPLWGFGCPLAGANLENLASEFVSHLTEQVDCDFVAINGLPTSATKPSLQEPDGFNLDTLQTFEKLGPVYLSEGIVRQVASLEDGYDEWLSRRSRKFRSSIRRSKQAATEAGISIVEVSGEPNLMERILEIEARSWKAGDGIDSPEMKIMYNSIVERLSKRDRLQAFIALDKKGQPPKVSNTQSTEHLEVGYILGGVRNTTYRGLQLSYDQRYAKLGIGNLLQLHQLEHLCNEGTIDTYDLGMDYPYKRNWADQAFSSLQAVIHRTKR